MSESSDADEIDGAPETPSTDDAADPSNRFRLGEGIAVEYAGTEGGKIRLTFYAGADTNDMSQIYTEIVSPDFYARHQNERGKVKNRLVKAAPDDVPEDVVRGEFEQLCRRFEEADVVADEDLRSPIVNQLLDETQSVEVHAGDEDATITVQLSRDDGRGLTLSFDASEWVSNDPTAKIREQYYVAYRELIEVTPEEWETLREAWDDRVERVVRDESSDDDETIHALIRELKKRMKVIEEYDKIRNDTKNVLYDRNNNDRADSQIQERHDEVDVLWVQSSVITELLDEMPGTSPDDKGTLASEMIRDGTLLRSRRQFGTDKLSMWAFDAEVFGGRILVGESEDDADDADDGDESDESDDDREVSI